MTGTERTVQGFMLVPLNSRDGEERRGVSHAMLYSTSLYLFGGRPWLLRLLPYALFLWF